MNRIGFLASSVLVALRFESEGHRPIDFGIARNGAGEAEPRSGGRMRLAEGQFGSQRVRGPNASIVVKPGAMISGVVQVQYTADWPAASVWLSMTPTWGDAKELSRDLTPLPTPVTQDIVDMSVGVQAPTTAGHYWLLFALDAEPAGGFMMSRTNWILEEPVWGDGNDVASLPDSAIRRANVDGVVDSWLALPANMPRAEKNCRESGRRVRGVLVRYCPAPLPLFGIEVVVR